MTIIDDLAAKKKADKDAAAAKLAADATAKETADKEAKDAAEKEADKKARALAREEAKKLIDEEFPAVDGDDKKADAKKGGA